MSLGERLRRPGGPQARYFLSISRGYAIRTVVLTPALFWTLAAVLPLSLMFGAAGATYLASVSGAPSGKGGMATVIATAPICGNLASNRAADDAALRVRLDKLLAREARLEQDGAILSALA